MLYLLYGPDTYSSRQKLRELQGVFEKKSGGHLGVIRVDLEDSPDSVSELSRSGSLFAARQLFIIENACRTPKAVVDRVLELADAWARDRETSAILWEGDLGEKEHPLLARMRKLATKAQEFRLLPPVKVLSWLDDEAEKRNLRLAPTEKRILVGSFGPDLWALSHELDKIQAGAAIQDRRKEEEKIWNFTDAFFLHRREAISPLAKLLAAGFEATYLLGALASALRTLALISWGLASGKLKEATSHLHPYVVKKNTELARRTNVARLRQYYTSLVNADLELKTGKFPAPLALLRFLLRR